MDTQNKKSPTCLYGLGLLFMMANSVNESKAAELSLLTTPAYLNSSVDANVFIVLDDSGSMDFEILTSRYFYYENYWQEFSEPAIQNGRWESYAAEGSFLAGSRIFYDYIFYADDNIFHLAATAGGTSSSVEENPQAIQRDWRARSADFNLLYYNPDMEYKPWSGLSDASFTAAHSNPQPNERGWYSRKDLTGFVFEIVADDHGFRGEQPGGPSDANDEPNGMVDLWDSRIRYTINREGWTTDSYVIPSADVMQALGKECNLISALAWHAYEDCFATVRTQTEYDATEITPWGRSLLEEQQNIANWYQYYRRRSLLAKGAISSMINNAAHSRFGLTVTNHYEDLFVEVPAATVTDYTQANAELLTALYEFDWTMAGSPLRKGLERAGMYFDHDSLLGKSDPVIAECQQNYAILLSDGYWNESAPSSVIGDEDADGNPVVTVADVARFYYEKDLSPLDNKVARTLIDSNQQQHMVTYTLSFGVKGILEDSDEDGYPDPELAANDNWGYPEEGSSESPAKIDDLWHAAFNSKGKYLSVQNPAELTVSLNAVLAQLTVRAGSSTAIVSSSHSLNTEHLLFQSGFDSNDWSGDLIAYVLHADGSINLEPVWSAAQILAQKDYLTERVIITFNPDAGDDGSGIAFHFPIDYADLDESKELSQEQVNELFNTVVYATFALLNESGNTQVFGENLVNYLRGDRSNEGIGESDFRLRNSVLADIIDSDPQYVTAPRASYPETIEEKSYEEFTRLYSHRANMIYVGANDGMLHGFDAASGVEKIAFIPSAVLPFLGELANPFYSHRNYVNATPVVVDAYLNETSGRGKSSAGLWRSVLVGGLGNGGQSIYALDVTDPEVFAEANADEMVLWEFEHEDLGYSYGEPSIAKMANGSWAAVFGNGYNNTVSDGSAGDGNASLFIVDIDSGELIKQINTGIGSAISPNGLSSPALIDVNADYVVDTIYAGDLQGNMWKFAVSSSNVADWGIAYNDDVSSRPLFTTFDKTAITTRPQVSNHPDNYDGYMVFFGTGKYLEQADNNPVAATTQSFYGIWDKDDGVLPMITASDLLAQNITEQFTIGVDNDESKSIRLVSNNSINFSVHQGWFLDLKPLLINGSVNAENFGEMQVSNAQLRDGRLIFSTLIPSQNPCEPGGSSYLMEISYRDGGALEFTPFDINDDGVFNELDAAAAGIGSTVGIVPGLSIVTSAATNSEFTYLSGSSGDIEFVESKSGPQVMGRQSWRQLK